MSWSEVFDLFNRDSLNKFILNYRENARDPNKFLRLIMNRYCDDRYLLHALQKRQVLLCSMVILSI